MRVSSHSLVFDQRAGFRVLSGDIHALSTRSHNLLEEIFVPLVHLIWTITE
jgi:hypothetical protein